MSTDGTHAQLKQAYALIKAKQTEKAVPILLPIVAAEPDNVNAWWLLANAQAEPVKARAALEQVLRLKPDHEGAKKQLEAFRQMEPLLSHLGISAYPTPPAEAASPAQEAVDFSALASTPQTQVQVPSDTLLVPSTPSATQPALVKRERPAAPSTKEVAGAGFAVFLLSIPVGGYITATLGVIDYLIFAFVTLILPALTDLNFFGLLLLIVFAVFIVIFGIIIAIAGGIVGLGIGAIIGFVNLVVSSLVSLVSRSAAALITPIVCAAVAVVAYHYLIYQPLLDMAARDSGWYEIAQHRWILDLNYIFAVILGGGISLMGLGAQTPADPQEAEREWTAKDTEDLKKAGSALAAPWKFFGGVAKGTLSASAYSYGEFDRSVKRDALKQRNKKLDQQLEDIRLSSKKMEEMNRSIQEIEKRYKH